MSKTNYKLIFFSLSAVGLCEKNDIESWLKELHSETRMIIALMRKLE
jgi:hypothetical protein